MNCGRSVFFFKKIVRVLFLSCVLFLVPCTCCCSVVWRSCCLRWPKIGEGRYSIQTDLSIIQDSENHICWCLLCRSEVVFLLSYQGRSVTQAWLNILKTICKLHYHYCLSQHGYLSLPEHCMTLWWNLILRNFTFLWSEWYCVEILCVWSV